MIETEASSEIDFFINFIFRNINFIENNFFKPDVYKIALQRKIDEYIIKEQERSKDNFLANKDLLIKDYLLQTTLFDKNLFPDNSSSGNKRSFLQAWLKERYAYAFGDSPDEFEKMVTFIWNGYEGIRDLNNEITSKNNCRNFFIALNYLYQPYNFNDSEKKLINLLFAFFKPDPVFAPKVLLSESSPPHFKKIKNFIEPTKSLVFEEVFASYHQELNLITLYKPGILWFCEENNCNFEDVKTVSLLYSLINFFLEIKQYSPAVREKVALFLLNHLLDEEIGDIPELMGLKGLEFIDEFPSEEVDKLDALLQNGVGTQSFLTSNFFCEERDKNIRDAIIKSLDDTFTYSAKKLAADLSAVDRPNSPENLRNSLISEYSILFGKHYELQITKIKKLKVTEELKNLLLQNKSNTFNSKDLFEDFIKENDRLKHLKFFFFDYFLQEKSSASISLLIRALKKSHISYTLTRRIYERETYQKTNLSLDDNGSEDDNNTLLNKIKDENTMDSADELILKDTSFTILRHLYELLAIKNEDINNLRKICKIFLADILGMKKINLAESLVVQPSVITEIEQKLAVDLIYLFEVKFSEYLKEIKDKDFSDVNFEKFEQCIDKFTREKLDQRSSMIQLKLLFVENLKNFEINTEQSSKTHYENIINALSAFEIKDYYLKFSKKFSLNEKQLYFFQEEFVNEIINSQRQRVRNLRITQEILKKVKDFATKEKLEKLQEINLAEIKDFFAFVLRFGVDSGRKIYFSDNMNDYKRFLGYLNDIIGQKFTNFKDLFFSPILKKGAKTEFSAIDKNDKNVIFFSFFLNFLINSFELAVNPDSNLGQQTFIVLKERKQLEKFLNEEELDSIEILKVDFINKREALYVQDIKS